MMDFFEYVMVMVSIVLGLGITQLLRGLGKIARGGQPYWVHTAWTVALLLLHLQVWWGLWDLHTVASWNLIDFLVLVTVPGALFATSELVVPNDSRAETEWRAHYYRIRPWFFAAFLVFQLVATLSSWVVNDVPLTHPYRGAQALEITIATAGLVTARPKVHGFLAAAYLCLLVFGQALFRFLPGLG